MFIPMRLIILAVHAFLTELKRIFDGILDLTKTKHGEMLPVVQEMYTHKCTMIDIHLGGTGNHFSSRLEIVKVWHLSGWQSVMTSFQLEKTPAENAVTSLR